MEQQGKAFLYLLLTWFFWFWILGTILFGLHFLVTFDTFSGLIFAVGAFFTALYMFLLKRNRTLREATNEFYEQGPPMA